VINLLHSKQVELYSSIILLSLKRKHKKVIMVSFIRN